MKSHVSRSQENKKTKVYSLDEREKKSFWDVYRYNRVASKWVGSTFWGDSHLFPLISMRPISLACVDYALTMTFSVNGPLNVHVLTYVPCVRNPKITKTIAHNMKQFRTKDTSIDWPCEWSLVSVIYVTLSTKYQTHSHWCNTKLFQWKDNQTGKTLWL